MITNTHSTFSTMDGESEFSLAVVNLTEEFCDFAERQSRHPFPLAVKGAILLVCAANVLVNCWLIFGLFSCAVFHRNLRAILANLAVCNVVHSAIRCAYTAYNLFDIALGASRSREPCDYAISDTACCLVMCNEGFVALAMVYAVIGVAVERIYASVRYKTYETTSTVWFPLLTILIPVYLQ